MIIMTNIKDFTLCQNNNFVSGNLRDLKRYLEKNGRLLLQDEKYMCDIINTCLEDLRIMKKQGQRMESRMKKYRASIEKLGFQKVEDK